MSRLSTRTVLFTDVVGSTAQRAALGDAAADALQHRHDALVGRAVQSAGGRVVKGLGDGAMASFDSAADAVDAAVALQQALAGEQLAVRVGIATGDVSEQDGDLLGTPVVEASRLCGAAAAGEVLVAELVRLLARGRSRAEYEPLGALELRGLPEPVPVCRVLWTPAPAPTAAAVPLPAVLAAAPASSYVGREALLQQLHDDWQRVLGGEGATVLLAGEPGIGKTRTAAELARAVHGGGGLVLFGRCDEGLGAPYQPFVEALDAYVRGAGPAAELGRLPGELQRLVPELSAPQGPVTTDVRSEEYRLFEAVTSWLAEASAAGGLLLVLDDLHWATRPTLQLLLHLLRRLADHGAAHVLVVGTYRDTDVDRAHPLVAALAELRRLPQVRRLVLGGLTEDDVLQVLEEAAGHELDEDARTLGRLLHAETEGNPFFVGEVLRHLVESGSVRRVEGRWQVPDALDLDIPEGVRDVVGRRVTRLGPQADAVLSVAAVAGREVSVEVLTAVSGLDEDAVCEALDEGVRARLLHETRAGHYRFSHALVRTTLYEELSATRRRRVHRKVADVLEERDGDVVELAHHLLEAGPEGEDVHRAVRCALAAGDHGLARRAPADAEVWFRHALELLDGAPADEHQRLRAAVGLGRAQHDQSDPGYRTTLLDASRAALALGEVDLLAEAVLANQRGYASQMGGVDGERVVLLEQALEAVGPAPTARRARLLAVLACEVSFAGDPARSRGLAAAAVALAEQVGDEPTTAAVMTQVCGAAFDPRDLPGWLALTTEAARRAHLLEDPGLRTVALLFRGGAELALGDLAQVRRTEVEMLEAAAGASRGLQWASRCQHLRFVVAEQDVATAYAENDACLALGEAVGEPDRLAWWASATAAIVIAEHGSVASLADLFDEVGGAFPDTQGWICSRVLALAQSGRTEQALALLSREQLDPVRALDEPFPLFGPAMLARIAFEVDDADLAARTERVLQPLRDCWAHYFIGILAPVAMALGLCASVLGRHDEAVALAQDGVALLEAAGLPALRRLHQLDLARVLARTGQRARLEDLCRALAAEAEADGRPGLAAQARRLVQG